MRGRRVSRSKQKHQHAQQPEACPHAFVRAPLSQVWLATYQFVDVAVKLVPWRWNTSSLGQPLVVNPMGAAPAAPEDPEERQRQLEAAELFAAELARFRQEVRRCVWRGGKGRLLRARRSSGVP